ncbi:MAG: hypothetical protein ACNS63_02435 [Candidatus Nitrospinota bacterium M3_3B_026]
MTAFLALCFLAAAPSLADVRAPELVTVAADAVVKVTNEDYARARQEAKDLAFKSAARKAVAGIVSAGEFERLRERIEAKIVEKSAGFVKSYKFLEEKADPVADALLVRLQVTLFLDDLRKAARELGARMMPRALPRLLVIVDERSESFISGGDFLLSNSRSERILAGVFRDRGFRVVDRGDVRGTRYGETVAEAMEGDQAAMAELGAAFDVDLLALGRAEVTAIPTEKGERVETVVSVSLLRPSVGEELVKREEGEKGLYGDVLEGSLDTIEKAARRLASEMALDIRAAWRMIREREG